ncbi:tyrosine-type recombinase/integrase [Verrucomicrobiota bacterium]
MSKHKLPVRRRGSKWTVDYRRLPETHRPDGCKVSGQLIYPTKAQAQGAAQTAWDDHEAAQLAAIEMTPARRALAIEAFGILKDYPDRTIVDAAQMYAERVTVDPDPKTIGEVVDEYLTRTAGVVEALTMRNDYRPKFEAFKRAFGERQMQTVTESELEQWLSDRGFTGLYRDGWRHRLVTFWQFAIDKTQPYAKHNAARGIGKLTRQQRRKLRGRRPAIMDAKEIKKLLDAALAFRDGEMLPYFAICALAGLRPHETRRIGWQDINMEDRELYVPAEASKTGDDREVKLPECLVAWLEQVSPFRRKGRVAWTRHGFDKVREKAGLKERWAEPKGHDILRHSAASHHFRLHGDAALTAVAMGHDVLVFREYYKARVRTKAEAQAYFNVWPKTEGRTIQFPAVKAG